jgi:hypothetical protein
MAFYMLGPDNTIVVDIKEDLRTAEFKSKMGWDDDVQRFQDDLKVLIGYNTPLYTEIRLKGYFPNMIDIDESAHESAIEDIDDFNAKQRLMLAEIDNTPVEEIRDYVVLFPTNYPELVNYSQLAKLRLAMDIVASPTTDSPGETILSEEEELANIKALYGILRSIEKSKDNSMVVSLLEVIGDAVEPDNETLSVETPQSPVNESFAQRLRELDRE